MPGGLIFSWASRGGLLKRRGNPDHGGNTPGGPVIRPADVSGSAPVGSTQYAVPAGALFVDSAAGSDTNAGTQSAPFKTVVKAISVVPVNGTIVCRGGIYHEGKVGTGSVYGGIPVATAGVSIQSYPNEAVWFDGSSVVTGWTLESAGLWRHDGWTLTLDRSPTYSFGAADDPRVGWSFINASYPTAAWPDRVFIDGAPLLQVNSKAGVTSGKFFMDQGNDAIYIGSDPGGKQVNVTDLQTTITGLAVGVKFLGLGFRRFAPSQPHLGAVKHLRSNCVMENCWFEDISCVAVGMQGSSGGIGSGQIVRNVTIKRSGSLGLGVTAADGIVINRVNISGSNIDHFNYAPSTGAIKITRLRGCTVSESTLSDNFCKGLWTDESVSNVVVHTNDVQRNEQRGVTFELSGFVTFVNNLVTDNGYNGVDLISSDGITMWNNTLVNNGAGSDRFGVQNWSDSRDMNGVSDNRSPMTSTSVGLDTRQTFPHPDGMTWTMRKFYMRNNVLGKGAKQVVLGVEDYNTSTGTARAYTAFGVDWNSNFYNRPAGTPTWMSFMPRAGSTGVLVQFSIADSRGIGFEANGTEVNGVNAINTDFTIAATYLASTNAKSQALPSDIAALISQPVGTLHAGCWR